MTKRKADNKPDTKRPPRKPEIRFYGTAITDTAGNIHFKPDYPRDLQRYLNANFKKGQKMSALLKRYFRNRTTGKQDEEGNQNGYLYGVVLPMICEVTGSTAGDQLDDLEATLLVEEGQFGLKKVRHVKEMNTVDFNWAVIDDENPNSFRSWAMQFLEIDIPLPDKGWKSKKKKST